MEQKKLPYSVSNLIYFEDNTFYEVEVEALKRLDTGTFGKISFYEKDFSESSRPEVIRRYESESYFGFPFLDVLADSSGKITNYKKFIQERVKKTCGVDLTNTQLIDLFGPLENKIQGFK